MRLWRCFDAKAQDNINKQPNKAAYNKSDPKKNAAKGASEDAMIKGDSAWGTCYTPKPDRPWRKSGAASRL